MKFERLKPHVNMGVIPPGTAFVRRSVPQAPRASEPVVRQFGRSSSVQRVNSALQNVVASDVLRAQVSSGQDGEWCEFEGGFRARYESEYKLIRIYVSGVTDVININLSEDGQNVSEITATPPASRSTFERLATSGILLRDWQVHASADQEPPAAPRVHTQEI